MPLVGDPHLLVRCVRLVRSLPSPAATVQRSCRCRIRQAGHLASWGPTPFGLRH